jgi:hypothetical protein
MSTLIRLAVRPIEGGRRIPGRGAQRALRALLLAGFLGAGACTTEAIEEVPPYPGASLGPGYRVNQDSVISLKQIYYTGDGYERVIAFYTEYVAREPGWQGTPSSGMTIWGLNMAPDQRSNGARALDPAKPGKLIMVVDEGMRTAIRTFVSQPGGV